jgi:hypothetical protein
VTSSTFSLHSSLILLLVFAVGATAQVITMMKLFVRLLLLIAAVGVASAFAPAPLPLSSRFLVGQRSLLSKSLFDEEDSDTNEPTPTTPAPPSNKKFTGQSYFKDTNGPPSNKTTAAGTGTPRDRMMQREYNLVSLATSPTAFVVQGASLVLLLTFMIYVGATGQLGLNNDYVDDDVNFSYDTSTETTILVPEKRATTGRESTESVWL